MEFPRQEYWSGLPLSTPGDLDPGIEPVSLMSLELAGGFLATITTWEAQGRLSAKGFSGAGKDS